MANAIFFKGGEKEISDVKQVKINASEIGMGDLDI